MADQEAPSAVISEMSGRGRAASRILARTSSAAKARALLAAAAHLRIASKTILAANHEDVSRAQVNGMSPADARHGAA
jgi:glutamate-5-semialdehyde dehydrogenase